MQTKEDITGIILAGGKSSRMDSDKPKLLFRGKRLIEYPYQLLRERCQKIIVSTNTTDLNLPGGACVQDNYKDIGPLAGLEAGLRFSNTRWNFVIPCDMPFVNSEYFSAMYQEIDGYDCVVPMSVDGKVIPILGFFNRDILPAVIRQINSRDYKAANLLKKVNVKYYQTLDNNIIVNVNSLADLELLPGKQQTKKTFWPNMLLLSGSVKNTQAKRVVKMVFSSNPDSPVKVSDLNKIIMKPT